MKSHQCFIDCARALHQSWTGARHRTTDGKTRLGGRLANGGVICPGDARGSNSLRPTLFCQETREQSVWLGCSRTLVTCWRALVHWKPLLVTSQTTASWWGAAPPSALLRSRFARPHSRQRSRVASTVEDGLKAHLAVGALPRRKC